MANPPHRRIDDQGRDVPEIGIDYAFVKDSGEKESLTIIVMKGRESKAIFANVVELKGRGMEGTIGRVIENLRRLGYKRLVFKYDQEPAILDLVNGIIEAREEETIPNNSTVGESPSNGVVERAVRSVKDQIRNFKLALQARIRRRVPQKHAAMTWLVEHAGDCITKHQVSSDGKTAYQRLMGTPCSEEALEFGETVNYRLHVDDLADLDARWSSGVWLGKRWRSAEHLIHTDDGVIHCRAVSRKPIEERWDRQAIESIVASPWIPRPSADD